MSFETLLMDPVNKGQSIPGHFPALRMIQAVHSGYFQHDFIDTLRAFQRGTTGIERWTFTPCGTPLEHTSTSPASRLEPPNSSLDLTMNVYTDPRLLDIGAAVDALPTFGDESPFHKIADAAM